MHPGMFLACCAIGASFVSQAHAQAIDPSPASATMGAPLDLQLLVRPAPELGATRFDRRCLHAEVRIGERLIDNQALRVEIGQAGDDGLNPVRLRHPGRVDEPVVQLQIHMVCGASYSREFNVLAHAPLPAAPRATSPSAPSDTSRSARRRTTPVTSAVASSRDAAPATPRPPNAPDHTTFGISDAPAHLPPDAPGASADGRAADTHALLRSVMKLLQTAGSAGHTGSLPAVAESASPDAIAQTSYLLQELQRLRAEQQQASTAIASLHARLARSEDERWLQAGWVTFAALAGLISFSLLMRLGDGLIPLLARRWRLARMEPGLQARRRQSIRTDAVVPQWPVAPPAVTPGSATTAIHPTENSMRSDGTGTTAQTIEFNPAQTAGETAGLHVATRDDRRAEQDRSSPDDEQHARARRWAKASFGPASLDHDIVRPLRDSIDDAIARGYLGFAATMLEQALYSGTGKHPWALMRLLDIYSALAQPDNHDRVCAEIETLYSVRPPSYLDRRATDHDDASAPCEASLLDTLVDWPALCAAWASDGAAALLETCLLRGKNKFELDISTFADLLFLHELAQTRAGLGNQFLLHAIQGDQTTAPPEPTIDTPPGVSTRSTTAMIDSTESSKGAHGTLV